jgi:anaerobic selenocysteine-containing dehydrogenase
LNDLAGTLTTKTFCAMCIARCGATATIRDGRFISLSPDPSHPTGQALCAKGRAAPELVYSPDRILYPMKRTRPKGDADPGWQRISWDEALDMMATAMRRIADQHGPEAVVFSQASGATTAIGDAGGWIRRLMNAFGTPNLSGNLDVCGWARGFATRFTYGVGSVATEMPGGAMADIAHTGCLILWGYNPSMTRLTHATAALAAVARGARLIVIDPRRVGLAGKADIWLRVRPGTDGALALGLAHIMIERGWYDRDFIRDWSNGPLLVRADNGRLLTGRDLTADAGEHRNVAWDEATGEPVLYDPTMGRYEREGAVPALEGAYTISTGDGEVVCHPAFELYARLCRRHTPEEVEAICWIGREKLEQTARILWESRPVSYYAYSGHEHHANTTQTARAISLLYALTGSFDAEGGNVLFPGVPNASVAGENLPAAKGMKPTLGLAERPLGVARWGNVTARELYTAILDGRPYPVRGRIGFGANTLIAHNDAVRGREALMTLDFHAHADMFMNPTAELADVILPTASPFERDGLRFGFEVSAEAQSLVQFRTPLVPPVGESRSDTEIVFDLAKRLGLGAHFWDGDIDAGYRHQLAASGVTLEALRAEPGGIRVPLEPRYRKYSARNASGVAAGFATPSRKVELYSETLLDHGYAPLPEYVEPPMGPVARPDLAGRYDLVLTSAKNTLFCNGQHRGLPSLRKRAIDPEVELHPDTAAARGIAAGAWVTIESPAGSARAKARLNASLDPRVVVGQHGWWQACAALGATAADPFSAEGTNFNLLIGSESLDPVSGTAPHKSYLCDVRPAAPSVSRLAVRSA